MMSPRFALPWQRSPAMLQRLTLMFAALGSGLAAPALINTALGGNTLSDTFRSYLAMIVSTMIWTVVFSRWHRRLGFWHFLWLGPLLGALNAGTSLALVENLGGNDMGIPTRLMVGTLFGTYMGGGPLGLLFGGGLALYHRSCKSAITGQLPHSTSQVLFLGATWLSAMAVMAILAGDIHNPDPHLQGATPVLCVFATALSLISLITHGWAAGWLKRLQEGKVPGFAIKKDADGVNLVVFHGDPIDGPFRHSESNHAIGPEPKSSIFIERAILSGVFMIMVGWIWIVD